MGGTGSYDPYRRDPVGSPGVGPGQPEVSCVDLVLTAGVQVPATPVDDLSVGAVLEVLRTNVDGAFIVAVVDAAGRLIGSIIDDLDRLLPCLSQGVAFIAEILTIDHGVPRVRIMAASIARVEGESPFEMGETVTPTVGVDAPLVLDSTDTSPDLASTVTVDVGSGSTGIVRHHRTCELRALMRVGVAFQGRIQSADTVVIRHIG